jgi:hypothetical protein
VLWQCRGLLGLGYLALALWLMAYTLPWVTRDGLGPDSVETTGWAALRKGAPVLLAGPAVGIYLALLHLCAWRLRRHGPRR